MLYFQTCVLLLLPLYVHSYNRITPSPKVRTPFTLPDHTNKDFIDQVRLPNESFCKEMSLKGADFYMVMPWWYHYCYNLKEQVKKGNRETERSRMLKPFQAVLERVQGYKKREKIWQKMANLLRP